MFFVDAIVFLLPWVIAGLTAARLSARGGSLWLTGTAAVAAVALYDLLVLALPFWGVASEALAGITATAALVPVMLLLQLDWHRPNSGQRPWLVFCVLPLVVGILMPWTIRVSYAQRVAWTCQGPIVSKYRSHNHNAPALVVQTAGRPVTLDGVDEPFWQQARVGEQLWKSKGSAFGRLNGRMVRVVPRTLPWWHEPDLP